MTMTNLTRRTALLGTVTLPAALAPLGLAHAAITPNATDAAWAELQAARAAYEAEEASFHAFEDAITAKIGWQPPAFMDDPEGWRARHEAYRQARAEYPENPHLDDNNPAGERLNDALAAMLHAPVATLVDVERKLHVVMEFSDGGSCVEPEWIEPILEAVRRINGRAA